MQSARATVLTPSFGTNLSMISDYFGARAIVVSLEDCGERTRGGSASARAISFQVERVCPKPRCGSGTKG